MRRLELEDALRHPHRRGDVGSNHDSVLATAASSVQGTPQGLVADSLLEQDQEGWRGWSSWRAARGRWWRWRGLRPPGAAPQGETRDARHEERHHLHSAALIPPPTSTPTTRPARDVTTSRRRSSDRRGPGGARSSRERHDLWRSGIEVTVMTAGDDHCHAWPARLRPVDRAGRAPPSWRDVLLPRRPATPLRAARQAQQRGQLSRQRRPLGAPGRSCRMAKTNSHRDRWLRRQHLGRHIGYPLPPADGIA